VSETKIVKAAPKKAENENNEEPRVVVKAANIVMPQSKTASPAAARQGAAGTKPATGARPPIGKPVVNKDLENRGKRPFGTAVIPKNFDERPTAAKAAEEAEAKKQAEAAKKAEAEAMKKAEAAQAIDEEAKRAEAEAKKAEAAAKEAEERKALEAAKEAEVAAKAQATLDAELGSGLKIISRAADEVKKPAEPKQAPKKDARPSREKGEGRDNKNGSRDDRGNREGRDNRNGSRDNRDNKFNKGDKPKFDRNDRGQKNFGGKDDDENEGKKLISRANRDRKPAQGFGVNASGGMNKPGANRNERRHGDKDRDKFSRFDSDMEPATLEKAAKKKHIKKAVKEEEPEIDLSEMPVGTRIVNVPITVAGFCEQLEVSTSTVIMTLMKLGIMANINQTLNEDTVLILADELGVSVVLGNVEEEEAEAGLETFEDKEEDLKPRAPIITVMGHVDHGKTSILDAIRNSNVTASESGGITQHIGASEVVRNGQKIVFLDTPGHEAFTAMRARGAHITDIAVLVVAADDGVMPQTIESISHAKAAGVPIIVAINKMDKPAANPDRVKQELSEHGILVEDWGGTTISVPVSAKKGTGIDDLLDMILLQAEMLELKANPNRLAMGTVIEARLDKNKGPVATLLVTNGTMEQGMSVVAGTSAGKIRLMTDYKGKTIKKAGPATAVEILGLDEVPQAGDEFNAVKDDKLARSIADQRKQKLREEVLARNASTTLEALFSQIQEGEVKELPLIIKADVNGSVGAIVASLEKLENENVRVKIIHTGVGTVTESDVMLASTSGAVIIGFNVRPPQSVVAMADRDKIEIRTYRVIYDIINDVEDAMKGMLDPEFKEVVLGEAEVRNTFKVPNVGIIAGAYVTSGKIVRNSQIRLVRDGIVILEGKISSLKRFKDDAKEVNQGYECGIGIENFNDLKEGDVIECFEMQEIKRD